MLFDNKYEQARIEKSIALKNLGFNPYRNDSARDITIKSYLDTNSYILNLESQRDKNRTYLKAFQTDFIWRK